VYARFREEDPVWWSDEIRMYCVFRHQDVKSCLTSVDYTVEYPFRISRDVFGETLLDIDGPAHQRLRPLLMSLLQGKQGHESFFEVADREVERIVSALAPRSRFDFVRDLAVPLPARITLRFIGLPPDDGPWVWERLGYLIWHLDGSRGDFDRVARLKRELDQYLSSWLSAPGQGHSMIAELRDMVAARAVTAREALGTVFLTLAAGIETSIAMFSNAMVCLLRHPEWMRRAQGNEEALKAFVREVARWEPPQHDTVRFARRDVELGGKRIKGGSALKLLLASGNRDERVFVHGEHFDPERPQRQNLSFGLGAHSCLGQHIAMSETAALLRALLRRFPAIECATPAIPPITGSTFRRPAALEIQVHETAEAGQAAMGVAHGA
jgi:cytochrome P450